MNHPSMSEWVGRKQVPRLRWQHATWNRHLTAFAVVLTCALLTEAGTARTWHVPEDAPTIQAGIDSAGVGEDVLVAPGTYFEHDIAMKSGTWVHSEQGSDATTVDAGGSGRGFDCADLQQTTVLEGFTIHSGGAHYLGGGVRCVRSLVVIQDCVISDCSAIDAGGGIYAHESDLQLIACTVNACDGGVQGGGIYASYPSTVTISDCEISNNTAGSGGGIGVLASEVTVVRCTISGNEASWGSIGGVGCISPMVTIRDCLISDNWERVVGGSSGLYVGGAASGSVSGCTVALNRGVDLSGPAVRIEDSGIEIERTIVAFNEGWALHCTGSQVTIHCCDVFGNTEGNDLCGTDLGGNFSADPLFCDPDNNDFTIDCNSPCLPGNHPDGVDCGLIGALGLGCGATPIENTSWGRIKSLYRR